MLVCRHHHLNRYRSCILQHNCLYGRIDFSCWCWFASLRMVGRSTQLRNHPSVVCLGQSCSMCRLSRSNQGWALCQFCFLAWYSSSFRCLQQWFCKRSLISQRALSQIRRWHGGQQDSPCCIVSNPSHRYLPLVLEQLLTPLSSFCSIVAYHASFVCRA